MIPLLPTPVRRNDVDAQPWELSRVRLRSVGPKSARYRDVTIDLSELGKPLPLNGHARQSLLFGKVPRRPSPASVLFLENGGGKSVLLKLVFSVLLPGRRQVVGTNSRVLENFVLDRDTAHVLLEWVHAKTGERLLTGKVMEWRGHTVSQDASRLCEEWYSLRPDDDLDITSMPFTVGGRLQPLAEYRRLLAEADRMRPARQMNWERTSHGAWTEHLDTLGLDYVRFRFQRAMNVDEGEAAGAFTFKTERDFIDWLLTSVLDDEDPRSFADAFDKYALNVGDRDQMLGERRFVDGAASLMKPVAAAAADRAAGQQMLVGAQETYLRLAAEVTARLAVAEEHHAERQAAATELATAYSVKEQARDDATKVVNEIRRLTDRLRLGDAEKQDTDLEKLENELRLRSAAWDAAELLVTWRQRNADVEALTARVNKVEQRAAPMLDLRKSAATNFVRALISRAAKSDAHAKELGRQAAGLAQQTATTGTQVEQLTAIETEASLLRQQAQDQLLAIGREMDAAVKAELLERDDDPAGIAEAATLCAAELADRFRDVGEDLARLRGQLRDAAGKADAARRTAEVTAMEAAGIEAEHARLSARAAELAGHERVGDLLALDADHLRTAVTVDVHFDVLIAGLDRATREAGRRARELQRAREDHERVLAALGDGGLLPARDDVLRAREALEAASVPSVTGWQYLASGVAAGERAAALSAHPGLVDGVVVTDPALLHRAGEVLRSARLLPRSAVLVGSSALLLDISREQDAGTLLVPPNPAMFDELAAEAERAVTSDRLDALLDELAEQENRAERDQQLLSDLRSWRRDCLPGHLAELADKFEQLRERHEREAAESDGLGGAASALEEQLVASELAYPQLQAQAGEAKALAERLAALARQVAERPRLTADVEREQQRARAADDERAQLRQARDQLTAQRDGLLRQAENATNQAARLREESGEVIGAVTDAPEDPAADDGTMDLPTLRSNYKAAARAYDEVAVGSELLDKLRVAGELQAQARNLVDARPEAERALAVELLRTPECADAVSRGAAKAADERMQGSLAAERRAISGRIALLTQSLAGNKPVGQLVWIVLPDERKPIDIEHGARLQAAAEDDQRQVTAELEELRARRDLAARDSERAGKRVEEFDRVATRISDDAELPQHAVTTDAADRHEPFVGTADQALLRRDTVREEIRAARELRDDAVDLLQRTADRLREFSGDDAFDKVGRLRRTLQTATVETLASHAAEWQEQLTARLRSLDTDLEEIDRNRRLLVDRLAALTVAALRVLRAAQRLSKLPAELDGWSEQEFLRIRFSEPDPAMMRAALGVILDETAAASTRERKPASLRRDGMALLLRAVHAAVPKGFEVLVLKPDAVLRAERVPVAYMGDVFSGGQRLTAAIVLYCAMAALRAEQRGVKMRHAGVLFLDNPIGRASAHYLLELQLHVAQALGVQLVYTTGLMEANALRVFPLIVRLRNDADLRAGLKYLQVEERIAEQLPDEYADDADLGTGTLAASRFFRRPVTLGSAADVTAEPAAKTVMNPS
jgi:hypothetical protein